MTVCLPSHDSVIGWENPVESWTDDPAYVSEDWKEVPHLPESESVRGTLPAGSHFAELVSQYRDSTGEDRELARREIADAINADPAEGFYCFNVAMQTLFSSRGGRRLDDAIDMLVDVEPSQLLRFALWTREADAIGTADDYYRDSLWYSIIRTLGGTIETTDNLEFRDLLSWALSSGNPSIREAALDSLAVIGNSWAIGQVERIASSDPSTLLREYAADVLRDRRG